MTNFNVEMSVNSFQQFMKADYAENRGLCELLYNLRKSDIEYDQLPAPQKDLIKQYEIKVIHNPQTAQNVEVEKKSVRDIVNKVKFYIKEVFELNEVPLLEEIRFDVPDVFCSITVSFLVGGNTRFKFVELNSKYEMISVKSRNL